MRRVAAISMAWLLGLSAAPAQAPASPGERLYIEHCALCHGQFGYDGIFANLALPRLSRAPDDQSMFKIIKSGIEGTDMSPAYGVTDDEVQIGRAHV